ncbi:MAG: hypothetical protein OXR82_11660 [Gammaproteobacteria bacterium]|nr:hypothetical protein [Gammaproteobacteria bacterium]MDE0259023.1 hypothetical protein [Gammaproteobacteria bacterium]
MDRLVPSHLALLPVFALGAATACAEREPDAVIEVDSAGVRIVESRAAAWPPGTEWRVDPEPVFRLGDAGDDPSSSFFRILDVALLAGGEVIVVDGGTAEVRRYDAAGRHLWSTGGRGEGPGEFRFPRYLGRRDDGAFLIWDRALSRVSTIGQNGDRLGTERRSSSDGSPVVAFGLFEDGYWLVALPAVRRVTEPGTAWTDSVRLGRYDPVLEEEVQLPTVLGQRWLWTGQSMLPVPFSPRPLRAIVGNRVAVASGSVPDVSIHDPDGSLVTRYRIARDRVPVTESDVGQVIESLVELGQGTAAVWRQWRDEMEVPAYEPAFDLLLADGDANLWAQRFTADLLSREPPSWDVFSPAGTWLGVVATPGGMVVTSIRDGLVAGVYRDELGVEYVSVHRLEAL